MEGETNKPAILALLIEAVVVTVLIILILLTLNYFGIIPISQTLKFLSFLPQQKEAQVATRSLQSPTGGRAVPPVIPALHSVITSNNPKKITNQSSEPEAVAITNSHAKSPNQIRIDIELGLDNNSSNAGGLLFTNRTPETDSDYRHLKVFFEPKESNWMLEYRTNSKPQYFFIAKGSLESNFQKLGLIIGTKGDTVSIIAPGTKIRTHKLYAPFSTTIEKQIVAVAQVAPKSELTIYSLSYQY